MSKILYTSDIHGNEIQYKKLVDYSIKIQADFIIIGGDIAPKYSPTPQFISGQKQFLKKELPKLLSPLKNKLPNSKIFLMMGNDDCKANMDILENNNDLYQVIHNKRLKLNNKFDIVGYSYVPITPFGIKDWEKYDFSNVPKNLEPTYLIRKQTNYRLEGVKSFKKGWSNFCFTAKTEKNDSIQKDLEEKLFLKNPNNTIYVVHGPPNDTNLDLVSPLSLSGRMHVGSMALRNFIEKYQPYLTLHGHIHETVEMSGNYKHKIGNTLCLSSGNHNVGDNLVILVFEIDKINNVKRIII